MRRSTILPFLMGHLIFLLFGSSLHAQIWKDLIGQADSLSKSGDLDSAVVLAHAALKKVEGEFGKSDTTVASVLNTLGKLYYYQARYADAEPLWRRALEIWEIARGPGHPSVAKGLKNLGNLYDEQGRYTEGEPLKKRALEILEKVLGPDHPYVAPEFDTSRH